MAWSRWAALAVALMLVGCDRRTRPPHRSEVTCAMTLTAAAIDVPTFPGCTGTWRRVLSVNGGESELLALGTDGGSWWDAPPGWRVVLDMPLHPVSETELDFPAAGRTFAVTVGLPGKAAWYDAGDDVAGSRAHLSLSPGAPWTGLLTVTMVADKPGAPETATLEVHLTDGQAAEVSP